MSPPRQIPARVMVDRVEVDRLPLSSAVDLTLPAVLLRAHTGVGSEFVLVRAARRPTAAFSARDLRSPHITSATHLVRDAGFEAVVRSPGGRMVAYDTGAVVIDHIVSSEGGRAEASLFAENAASHCAVLRSLGLEDVRVGETDGEYCPGEFSVNVAGASKVVGSAQRITSRASLLSTVIQVSMSDAVREVIEHAYSALGYPLLPTSIAGVSDFAPGLTTHTVVEAFRDDYRARLRLEDGPLPGSAADHAASAARERTTDLPFHVDDWVRSHPLPEPVEH